eukprot:gb/GEZN01003375.1/.p1 GENE.gb/GEZN01003375.1/~~gb/GEZN01003375.1/.p1  ORF type:complete len:654 (-),score=45.01 gb/GEZN01003375.1/:197-2158(-)
MRRRNKSASTVPCTSYQQADIADGHVPAVVQVSGAQHQDVQEYARGFYYHDSVVSVLLLAVGIMTRLYPSLSIPGQCVFDEVHVGRFVMWYSRGQYFFDMHPPAVKLIYFVVSRALGFPSNRSCSYSLPHEKTTNLLSVAEEECDPWELRLCSAMAGAVLIPTFYLTCRRLGNCMLASLVASLFLVFDNLTTAMSRIHMNDMGYLLFAALTVTAHARTVESFSATEHLGLKPLSLWNRFAQMLLVGVLLGVAISSRFGISLPLVAWIGLYEAARVFNRLGLFSRCRTWFSWQVASGTGISRKPNSSCSKRSVKLNGAQLACSQVLVDAALTLLATVVVPCLVFLVFMYLHFRALPSSGHGDGYMSEVFQATLVGSQFAAKLPESVRLGLLGSCWDFVKAALEYNAKFDVYFPLGSNPGLECSAKGMLLMEQGVLFHLTSVNKHSALGVNFVYVTGNPVVWGVSTFVVCVALPIMMVRSAFRRPTDGVSCMICPLRLASSSFGMALWLWLGWGLHYLPFLLLRRQIFLQYYMQALYFSLIGVAFCLNHLPHPFLHVPTYGLRAVPFTVYVRQLWRTIWCTLLFLWIMELLVLSGVSWYYLRPLAFGDELLIEELSDRLDFGTGVCWFAALPTSIQNMFMGFYSVPHKSLMKCKV